MAVLVLDGCSIPIKDHEFCADFGPDGAHCAHFLTDEVRDIPKPEWDLEREDKMVCETSDVFADWKATIEKLCSATNRCKYEEVKAMRDFFAKMKDLTERQSLNYLQRNQDQN